MSKGGERNQDLPDDLRIADPLAAFECRVMLNQRIGTHHVFFGAVEALHFGNNGLPHLYAARTYGVFGTLPAMAEE